MCKLSWESLEGCEEQREPDPMEICHCFLGFFAVVELDGGVVWSEPAPQLQLGWSFHSKRESATNK